MNARAPADAVLFGGIWFPSTETHMPEVMNGKDKLIVDGLATYQYRKLAAAMQHQPPERRGLALDIGAHVGLWSMWLARHFERLVAFEPVPEHAGLFRRNVGMPNVELLEIALADREGTADMEVPLETTGNAHIAIGGPHPGTRGVAHPERIRRVAGIAMKPLDSLGFTGVDFIKLDVEGFERRVLSGAERTIRASKPWIVVEQKGNEAAYGESRDSAGRLLESWGMRTLEIIAGDWILGWK